ncbi:hypothetical protein BKA81DRAFT_198479 [Phyllosticta paracitricarpa]|uniref:Uncharacterized protein n=1 Tax=Phyllosticta paracitricarpa TaxID=2016321 RepID=A0ABR1MTB4_9PEZI
MSSSNDQGDDALLARLNALKKSSVTLSTAPPGAEIQPDVLREVADAHPATSADETKDPVVDLATRFKRLHTPSPRPGSSGKASPAVEDAGIDFGGEEQSLDVLLKELGGEEWDLQKGEERDLGKLVKEVRSVLPSVETPVKETETAKGKNDPGIFDEDAKELDLAKLEPEQDDQESDEDALDDQEADEYIAQVLAELEIQEKYGEAEGAEEEQGQDQEHPEPPSGHNETQRPARNEKNDHSPASNTDADPAWPLPAAPKDLSQDSGPVNPDDETLNARLTALSGNPSFPTAPSFAPSKKPPKKTNRSQFTDEEIDSWCTICFDNATLRCLGCDGDLYCRNCWLEGHKGESAGFEERMHRAVEFVRGGGLKKEKKVAIFAG